MHQASRKTTTTVSPRSTGESSRAADQEAARTATIADPRITKIQREFGASRSRRQRYADLVIGQAGLWPLVRYELTMLLSAWVPGALGLFLRSKLYPTILGRVGKNVAFGCNVVLRHPHKIQIDDDVVVDDNCCLDAKGTTNRGIVIRRGVFLGRNTILSCKNGDIVLDEDANIGFNVEVYSAATVRIGRKVLVAAYSYLVGGVHIYDRVDVPVLDQGGTARGIEVDDNAWIGAHVVVTDGVHIGRDAVIGAGAVVTSDVPEFHVAAGVPARVIRDRRTSESGS
jgi:acetyltransferase-like isoleucine patch superfamily enzyme